MYSLISLLFRLGYTLWFWDDNFYLHYFDIMEVGDINLSPRLDIYMYIVPKTSDILNLDFDTWIRCIHETHNHTSKSTFIDA